MPRRERQAGRSRVERRTSAGPVPVAGRYPVSTGEVELVPDASDPGRWTLLVNGVPSSPVQLDDATVLEFEYLRWMADVVDVGWDADETLDVVHLGGAACALPRYVEAVRPGSRQVVIELDAELARLVRTWFDLPRSPRLRIQVADARDGLARRREASADVVVRDVFAGDATPAHVRTAEFLADVARVLRPGGIYLANVADAPPLHGLRAELATASSVFDHVALVAETAMLRGRRYANAVVVASRRPLPLPGLQRRVSSGAVAARLVHGDRVDDLAGASTPLRDPARTAGPHRTDAGPGVTTGSG